MLRVVINADQVVPFPPAACSCPSMIISLWTYCSFVNDFFHSFDERRRDSRTCSGVAMKSDKLVRGVLMFIENTIDVEIILSCFFNDSRLDLEAF